MTTVTTSDQRNIELKIPARADYLVLARLALAAVCRLTPLSADGVADLKLAVTEAAADFVVDVEQPEPEQRLEITAELLDEELAIELGGRRLEVPETERQLSRAIIEATVDRAEFTDGSVRLLKRLRDR